MVIIRSRFRLPVVAGILACTYAQITASPLDETVSVLEKWVETERQISDAKAEWEANKASMENLISIYTSEIASLSQQIEDAKEDTSAAEAHREALLVQDESVKKIETVLVKDLIQAENEIKELQPLLPPPLKEELGPLFNTIPADPETTKLSIGQRIQPIVAILTQVQKFNQVVTVVEGFREFEQGRTVQTEIVYLGLGSAYYVDQANQHAGVGVLGSGGWTWKDDDSLVGPVRTFLDIYRGSKQASYVQVPFQVN